MLTLVDKKFLDKPTHSLLLRQIFRGLFFFLECIKLRHRNKEEGSFFFFILPFIVNIKWHPGAKS